MNQPVEEECRHLMPISQCGWCTPRATAIDAPHQVEIKYEFLARFDGSCPGCGRAVFVGEPMARTTDGELVCARCPGVELELR